MPGQHSDDNLKSGLTRMGASIARNVGAFLARPLRLAWHVGVKDRGAFSLPSRANALVTGALVPLAITLPAIGLATPAPFLLLAPAGIVAWALLASRACSDAVHEMAMKDLDKVDAKWAETMPVLARSARIATNLEREELSRICNKPRPA